MKKMFPIIIILLIVIVIIVLSLSRRADVVVNKGGQDIQTGIVSSDANNAIVGISIGNRAPNFRLQTFDGNIIELANINKPVVIDFWAGWCPFCLAELPELEAGYQTYKDDIVFLGIHRSETESVEKGKQFADERGVTYPLLKDTNGEVYNAFTGGQPFMPVAFFIDEQGIIIDRVFGPKSESQIQEKVEKLFQ